MAKKIEFKVQIFFSDHYPVTYRTVTNIVDIMNYCQRRFSQNITAVDIWRKSTKEYLTRVHTFNEAIRFYHSLPSKYE